MSVRSSGVYTPTSAYGAFCSAAGLRNHSCSTTLAQRTAGLSMGPRMLNAVRTPSALRTGATCCAAAAPASAAAAHAADMDTHLHGWVVARRKHEADAHFANARPHALWPELDLCAKGVSVGQSAHAAARTATPSFSTTSPLPHMLDTERLPCLATRAPAAAAMTHAPVEMLTVPALRVKRSSARERRRGSWTRGHGRACRPPCRRYPARQARRQP